MRAGMPKRVGLAGSGLRVPSRVPSTAPLCGAGPRPAWAEPPEGGALRVRPETRQGGAWRGREGRVGLGRLPGSSTRAPARRGGSGGAGRLHPRARRPSVARPRLPIPGAGSGLEAAAAAAAAPLGSGWPARRGAGRAAAGRWIAWRAVAWPAEPWRPRSRRRGGAGSGSGRTRVRTRATSWRRAHADAGRSGASRWAPAG